VIFKEEQESNRYIDVIKDMYNGSITKVRTTRGSLFLSL